MNFWTFADLEARVDQLKASETYLKNIIYREKYTQEVLEYEYKQLLKKPHGAPRSLGP
jgi:hypothetical protein